MKKIILFSFAVVLGYVGYSQAIRELSSFSKVSAQEGIAVYLKYGNEETAKIDAQGIDEDEVLTEVNGSTLKIHLEDNNYKNVNVKVYVTYKTLSGLKASSASTIDVEGEVKSKGNFDIDCSSAGEIRVAVDAEDIEIEVSSSGDLDAEINGRSVDIEVSSAGDIDIRGKVVEAEISASSSGEVDGYDLICEEAEVRASSGGSIKITVNQELEAKASSGGSIRYKGSPQNVSADRSSGGSVKKS